jgi:hypothetical protein
MPDLAWLLLALLAVVVFGRFVTRLIRRYLPLMVAAVVAAIVLSQCDGSEINF